MYPFIGVGLQLVPTLILTFGRSAKQAFSILPGVFDPLIPDISAGILKSRDVILAVGELGTVDTSPREQAGQFSDGDGVELVVENVVDALLQIGDLGLQPFDEPLGDLPQKYPGFAGRVQEGGIGVGEQLLGKHVQHLIGHLRRGEHLVIGVILGGIEISHGCPPPALFCNLSGDIPGWGPG